MYKIMSSVPPPFTKEYFPIHCLKGYFTRHPCHQAQNLSGFVLGISGDNFT